MKSNKLQFSESEIVMKALFLESRYSKLLKEITAQKSLFKDTHAYWVAFFKVAQYQIVCQRIITNHFPSSN